MRVLCVAGFPALAYHTVARSDGLLRATCGQRASPVVRALAGLEALVAQAGQQQRHHHVVVDFGQAAKHPAQHRDNKAFTLLPENNAVQRSLKALMTHTHDT